MSDCLSDFELDVLHAGEMDAADEQRARAHLAICARCSRRDAAAVSDHEAFLRQVRSVGRSAGLSAGRASSDMDAGARIHVRGPGADGGDDSTGAAASSSGSGRGGTGGTVRDSGAGAGMIEGYDILRELHRGGQGVVYQAIQMSTKRKVAVKVLLEGPYASASARRRFEREIELVARLKHPHIVSVFDSGTASDGRLYCVMDYVAGARLDHYVRDRRPSVEDVLRLFAQVCEAVNYAHQNGVIHRDLKPSNVLVDSDGHPKVLDFGLAKPLSGPAEPLLSMTGQLVGTLPYMSPEQARGRSEAVDIRTDVYALGVLLFELLTGRFPYPVAGEPADVLRHIAETPPSPPRRAWRSDSGVTWRSGRRGAGHDSVPLLQAAAPPVARDDADGVAHRFSGGGPESTPDSRLRRTSCPIDDEVETIILKALSKERERRYQTAGELARDIDRYLSNQPIEAKRDSGWYILKKAVSRHRGLFAAAAAFVLLLGGWSVSASILYSSSNRLWQEAEQQTKTAEQQRDRARDAEASARHRFNQVRALAKSFIFDVHDRIENLAGATPARQMLVTTALEYLDNLASEAGDDPSLQRELAQAYVKVGDVQGGLGKANLGDTAGALASYRKALEISRALAGRADAARQDRRYVAVTLNRVGDILRLTAQTADALAAYEEARSVSQALADLDPADGQAQWDVAVSHEKLGGLYQTMGKGEQSLAAFRKTQAILDAYAASHPDDAKSGRERANILNKIGDVLAWLGRDAESLAAHQESRERHEALLAADPNNADLRRAVSITYDYIGKRLAAMERSDEALGYIRKCVEMDEALLAADPANAQARRDLMISNNRLAMQLVWTNHADEALPHCRRALELAEALSADDPGSALAKSDLAIVLLIHGGTEDALGRPEDALKTYRKALKVSEAVADADPQDATARRGVASACVYIADTLRGMGRDENRPIDERIAWWTDARRHYQRALDVHRQLDERGMLMDADRDLITGLQERVVQCDDEIRALQSADEPQNPPGTI